MCFDHSINKLKVPLAYREVCPDDKQDPGPEINWELAAQCQPAIAMEYLTTQPQPGKHQFHGLHHCKVRKPQRRA